MGSRFRYSGRTEFQTSATVEPRRRVQFERKPSTRYARRKSHILREHEVIHRGADYPAQNSQLQVESRDMMMGPAYAKHEPNLPATAGQLEHEVRESVMWEQQPAEIQEPRRQPTLLADSKTTTRSIVDIISEFNAKHEDLTPKREQSKEKVDPHESFEPDMEYLKWVSASRQQETARLTVKVSSSSGKSGSSLESGVSGSSPEAQPARNSSPDSGCDMSVMVAYTSEPKVRRVDPADKVARTEDERDDRLLRPPPVPAPRHKSGNNGVVNVAHNAGQAVVSQHKSSSVNLGDVRPGSDYNSNTIKAQTTKDFGPAASQRHVLSGYPPEIVYGSSHSSSFQASDFDPSAGPPGGLEDRLLLAKYSQVPPASERAHRSCEQLANIPVSVALSSPPNGLHVITPDTSSAQNPLESPCSRDGLYSLEGKRLKCLGWEDPDARYKGQAKEACYGRTLRSYASSRDILQMYGQGVGLQPLAPRMVGFSSCDLRLPPAVILQSLSGRKSNSTLSVDCNSKYQNVPNGRFRQGGFDTNSVF